MKNFMIKKLLILSSIIFLFSACSNMLGESNKKSEISEKDVTVKGYLSTSGNSRTAFVSFEGITWKVQAYNDKASKYADVDGSTFSISLPVGEWTLTAIGYDSTGVVIAAGTTKITVKENEPQENLIIQVIKAHGQGNIALKVVDKTEKAAKLVCSYKYLLNGNVTSAPDFTANFIDGAVTIKFENVYTGEAEITIYDAEDVKLFSCKEKINVLFEMTTDVFADCDYVKDGVLTITDDVLKSYPVTQIDYPVVLWNGRSSDYGKYYCQGVQVFGAADSETVISEPLFSGRSNTWCFGESQSIYYVTLKSDNDGFFVEKCVPGQGVYYPTYEKLEVPVINYEKTDETGVYRIVNIAFTTLDERSYLFVLYGTATYTSTYNSARLRIFDITDWNGGVSITQSVCLINFSETAESPLINDDFKKAFITVSGDDVFIVRKTTSSPREFEIRTYKFVITEAEDNQGEPQYNLVHQDNDIDIYSALAELDSLSIDNLNITDMTIVGNYLYILVCSSSNYGVPTSLKMQPDGSNMGKYFVSSETISGSAGGILKFKLENNPDRTFEEWPDGSLLYGCYSTELDFYDMSGDEYFELENTPETYQATVITQPPVTLESKYFFGPRKIIARKPDELIIADDGYDYQNWDDKNRMIKLNLSKWAITSVEDAGVMFDGFVCNGCGGYSFKIE